MGSLFINKVVRLNSEFRLSANLKLLVVKCIWLMFRSIKTVFKSFICGSLRIIKTKTWYFLGIVNSGLDKISKFVAFSQLILIARK